jgi:hypothetical protein
MVVVVGVHIRQLARIFAYLSAEPITFPSKRWHIGCGKRGRKVRVGKWRVDLG